MDFAINGSQEDAALEKILKRDHALGLAGHILQLHGQTQCCSWHLGREQLRREDEPLMIMGAPGEQEPSEEKDAVERCSHDV